METLCVRCDGTAEIAVRFSFENQVWSTEPCPDCAGTGFVTEAPVVMPVVGEKYSRYVEYRRVP